MPLASRRGQKLPLQVRWRQNLLPTCSFRLLLSPCRVHVLHLALLPSVFLPPSALFSLPLAPRVSLPSLSSRIKIDTFNYPQNNRAVLGGPHKRRAGEACVHAAHGWGWGAPTGPTVLCLPFLFWSLHFFLGEWKHVSLQGRTGDKREK